MKDSILKGTGNSRFLKSAIPEGTTWAEALAMLRAGTFPMDLNGINTEGFQQVGTPLNKANLLKDVTALTLGLTGDAVPNDMFNALAHAGDLHVWRKTVTTSQEIPAGYTLGELQTGSFPFVGADYVTWESGTPIVADDGTVSLKTSATSNVNFNSNLNDLKGTYCKPNTTSGIFSANQVIFIPSDANFISAGNTKNVDKYQLVIGTPKTPAGTTTTYPVSTNRNAYQEGNDAKPAGYTLGEVVTGSFRFATNSNHSVWYHVSDSLNVADDGTISLGAYERVGMRGGTDYNSSTIAGLKGKFIQLESNDYAGYVSSPFSNLGIYYVPSDAVFSGGPATDRYQPVTGYAAIPANTTIEYLGCLGDKARVQVVSYVGTGTYGEDNPNSLTFDFVPKAVIISSAPVQSSYVYIAIMVPDAGIYSVVMSSYLGYESRTPGGSGIVTKNNKTITFYSGDDTAQLNGSGIKYTAVAIG